MSDLLPSNAKKLSRGFWIVLSVGIGLLVLGWAYWMQRVGPSWWFAYRDGKPGRPSTGMAAERVRTAMLIAGAAVCTIAPFVSRVPLRHKFIFSLFMLALSIVCYYVLAFIVFVGIYGF